MSNYFRKRKNRRRAILQIVCKLDHICFVENEYLESIPDTLANEDRLIESEYLVNALVYASETLKHAI